MIEEQQLIPYHSSPLPAGKKWLIFAPHADDETFGMGGTLLLARQQSIQCSLLIMTDGRLGIKNKQAQQAAEIRVHEAKKAAELLGIETILFLQEEDRGLSLNQDTLKKITDIINQLQPDNLFVPTPLELHPDHRMTTYLVWQAIKQINYHSQLYGYEITGQGPIDTLIDITSVIKHKHEIMQVYQSQIQQNNYIAIVQALDIARTFTLEAQVQSAEGFIQFDLNSRENPWQQVQSVLSQYAPPEEHLKNTHDQTLAQKITQLEEENSQLLHSTSWKITHPLRWFKTILK